MITYLGSASIAETIPLFANSLATTKGALLQEIADLATDALALQGDIVALEADAAAVATELADVNGLADGILQQLAAGPAAVVQGIESAIAALLDGSSLRALQEALLGGPAAVLASLQAALAQVQDKITSIQSRLAGLAARVIALLARIQALAARVAGLKDLLARLLQMQNLLATAGIHLFRYAGSVGAFGSELDAELANGTPGGGNPTDLANALVLVTTATSPWAALAQVLKVAL